MFETGTFQIFWDVQSMERLWATMMFIIPSSICLLIYVFPFLRSFNLNQRGTLLRRCKPWFSFSLMFFQTRPPPILLQVDLKWQSFPDAPIMKAPDNSKWRSQINTSNQILVMLGKNKTPNLLKHGISNPSEERFEPPSKCQGKFWQLKKIWRPIFTEITLEGNGNNPHN